MSSVNSGKFVPPGNETFNEEKKIGYRVFLQI